MRCVGHGACINSSVTILPGGTLWCENPPPTSGACSGHARVTCIGDCTLICQGDDVCSGNTYIHCAPGAQCNVFCDGGGDACITDHSATGDWDGI